MSVKDVAKVRDGLGVVIELDGGPGENRAGRLVAAYLGDDGKGFAGRYFDSLGENPPDAFVPADLLALGLLDVPATWPVIAEVLAGPSARAFDELLAKIPANVDLWEATDDQLEAATALWSRIRKIHNMGWVRSHKLLAHKRPRLHPVYDTVVRNVVPEPCRGPLRTARDPEREALPRRAGSAAPPRRTRRPSAHPTDRHRCVDAREPVIRCEGSSWPDRRVATARADDVTGRLEPETESHGVRAPH